MPTIKSGTAAFHPDQPAAVADLSRTKSADTLRIPAPDEGHRLAFEPPTQPSPRSRWRGLACGPCRIARPRYTTCSSLSTSPKGVAVTRARHPDYPETAPPTIDTLSH
jgi:hypothetical protein